MTDAPRWRRMIPVVARLTTFRPSGPSTRRVVAALDDAARFGARGTGRNLCRRFKVLPQVTGGALALCLCSDLAEDLLQMRRKAKPEFAVYTLFVTAGRVIP